MTGTGSRKRIWPWIVGLPCLIGWAVVASLKLTAESSSSQHDDGPVITTPTTVGWGEGLYGVAASEAGPISVSAFLNGTRPVPGSPDDNSTQTSNSFCFPVPVRSGLGFIKLVATDKEGNSTTRIVAIE